MNSPTPTSDSASDALRAEWRCFHCDDVFTDERRARLHFGANEDSAPACQIKAGAEGRILRALRDAEAEADRAIQAVADECTDAAKAYHAAVARHSQALIAAEELGYERGLADARTPASPPAGADAGLVEADLDRQARQLLLDAIPDQTAWAPLRNAIADNEVRLFSDPESWIASCAIDALVKALALDRLPASPPPEAPDITDAQWQRAVDAAPKAEGPLVPLDHADSGHLGVPEGYVLVPRARLEAYQRIMCGDWCNPGKHMPECDEVTRLLAASSPAPHPVGGVGEDEEPTSVARIKRAQDFLTRWGGDHYRALMLVAFAEEELALLASPGTVGEETVR
jgi:hypothetical protein